MYIETKPKNLDQTKNTNTSQGYSGYYTMYVGMLIEKYIYNIAYRQSWNALLINRNLTTIIILFYHVFLLLII